MHYHPARLNQKKRDGESLSPAEIQDLVAGVVDGSLHVAQLGAFLMAVWIAARPRMRYAGPALLLCVAVFGEDVFAAYQGHVAASYSVGTGP